MEWRERSSVSCDEAYSEAQRWIEAVTKKKFGSNNFRSALENGVLLCDLINRIKPGVVRRVNRLPTPIAGLDNLNVFLRACGKLGLKEAQLFHPGDLQDLSTRVTVKHEETCRRLKNVLITIYWLGRRAQSDRLYDGPYLNFKAFEGLLGTALYKALQDTSSQKGSSSIRDSGFADKWFSEQEELNHLRSGGGGERHRRDDSSDSLDSLGSRPHSVSSEATLKGSSEGWYSDTEADFVFRMTDSKDRSYRRSLVLTPKASAQFNQFLPTKDKQPSYVPAPLRKKRAERNEESRRSWTSSGYTEEEGTLTSLRGTKMSSDSQLSSSALPAAHLQWAYDYESGSDSDTERPDPDLVLDDLASRRFHSPSPATPVNFAVPASPLTRGGGGPWPKVTMTSSVAPQQNVSYLSNSSSSRQSEAQPPPHCSVKVDHNQVVSTDSLFREIYGTSGDEDDEVGYADPIQDDLYTRKMGVKPQSPCMTSYDKFLPKFWTPQEDVHIQKIKLGSQQRPWYKKMQGFSRKKSGSSSDDSDCDLSTWLSPAPPSSGPPHPPSHSSEATPETTVVVGKRSKSTSDIETDTSAARQQRYEELQKYREHVKESEDQWQNDLSKWKNRRRSVNSDIVKKKEEREQIEQITTSSNRRSRTFREMQEERDSNGSRLSSLSYFNEDDDAFDGPVIAPRSRTLPARSYTIDTPYSSGSSVSFLKEKEPPAASPARGRASSPLTTPSIDREVGPTGSSTNSHQSSAAAPSQTSPVLLRSRFTKTEDNTRAVSLTSSLQRLPESRRPLSVTGSQVEPTSFGSQFKQPQLNPMEPNPPAVSRVSASLPRSYQRLDSARLTSVVTPRPFGTQTNRISSLSRTNPMDNSQKTINGEVIASKKSLVPSRYHQFMTPEDEEQSNSNHSTEDEEQEEEAEKETRSPASTLIATSTQSISPVLPQVKPEAPEIPAPTKESSQESRCEMRISLNQKPNSSRDFGFQANWDSTGARVSSIQPGSPAQMCQLLPGDEVLTVNGHKVADLSYTEWKAQLEEALQEGSLVMDISRKGQNTWDRNQPSLPFRSHKTLNLTSMDHPILLGSTETKPISSSLDFTSRMSSESLQTTNILAHQVVDVASNGVNGGFRAQPVTMRNKESEPMSLKNLKRRSEFFEKGGPESTMPEIPVPSITPSSRWSWDPEEERRRQEKWQKEQERLLQEKYKRDHEKLQEEWEKAQEEIASSVNQQSSSLEVNSRTASLSSPDYPFDQPTSLLWEAEEDRKRKEEQERQRQAEERRKRDEEERELQRLRVERERRERQEEEERKRREEEEQQWQIKREEEERKRREEELRWQREREEVEERKRREEELKWQRKREEEEAERKRREEEELRWQRRREEEEAERKRKEEEERRWQIRREEEERRWQEAAEQQRRERERVLEQQQQQRAGGPHGFVHSQPQLSFIDRTKSKSSPQLDEVDTSQPRGVYVQPGGLAHWLLEEQQSSKHDSLALSERAASELELERRHILSAMRSREPERVTGGGLGERKGHQSVSQAELERQQILNEMKKKAPLLTDNSWIRQRSSTSASNKESDVPPMRRGESLDNLNPSYNSWRSSWTPRSNTHVQNYSRPHSALSGTTSSFYGGGFGPPQRPASSTLPPSYSMSSLRGGAGRPTSPWSRQSHPSSPSPTTSPEPELEAPQQRNRSVSGKKICTFCENPLGKGAAMIIESLGLCYHLSCFKCFDCKSDLGGSEAGAEVRIRNKQLYCNNCYMGFKSGQPTSM